MSVYTDPTKRHDFLLLFDVKDGNPNGDPDAGNLPRVDPQTMEGLVTDVAIKRKVRNYVDLVKGDEGRYKIYVQHRTYLVDHKKRAYEEVGAKKGDDSKIDEARQWMCGNFYDVRLFGGVLVGKKGEGYNCGQVRGLAQLTFARSVDPVLPMDLAITRVALENPGEKPRVSEDERPTTGMIGRKTLVHYGLYKGYGFINPKLGEHTGLNQEDLEIFWEALQNMWDHDRSAARGMMACRRLIVFTHDNALGNAPAHTLLERVSVERKDGEKPPRSFDDYTVTIDEEGMPEGITLTQLV